MSPVTSVPHDAALACTTLALLAFLGVCLYLMVTVATCPGVTAEPALHAPLPTCQAAPESSCTWVGTLAGSTPITLEVTR